MTSQHIIFQLDDQTYALPIEVVERVVQAVAVTPVGGAPLSLLGVINVQGRIIPVLSLRKLFGLPDCVVAPAHQFLIALVQGHTVALVVDAVTEIRDGTDQEMRAVESLLPGCRYLVSQDQQAAGMVTVLDLDTLLGAAAGGHLPASIEELQGVPDAAA